MIGTYMKLAVRSAILVAGCVLILNAAQAQESWGSSRGGSGSGSIWGGGPAKAAMPTPQKPGAGSVNWTAGKQNFGSAKQAGGVWLDDSALLTTSTSFAKGQTPGAPKPDEAFGILSQGLTPVVGKVPSNMQLSHAKSGLHASSQLHFGKAGNSHGSPFKSSRVRTSAFGSQNAGAGSATSSTPSSLGSATLNSPELRTGPNPSLLPEFPNSGASQQEQLH
jgi:hypothetical protein